MSQATLQERTCVDFPTTFGDASEEALLKELSEILDETDHQELFRRAYGWYYGNKETQYADRHFLIFRKEGGELPYYVKSLLLRFRTEPDFSM